ncbi:MAG: hypothetical protein ACERKZ_14890 [Lachnotalea sp.]
MKKVRLVLISLNILIAIYSVYAWFQVWGDKLLYINSTAGLVFSHTYRISVLLCMLLLIINLFIFVVTKKSNGNKTINKINKTVKNSMNTNSAEKLETELIINENKKDVLQSNLTTIYCSKCGAKKRINDVFCGECGFKF